MGIGGGLLRGEGSEDRAAPRCHAAVRTAYRLIGLLCNDGISPESVSSSDVGMCEAVIESCGRCQELFPVSLLLLLPRVHI